MAVTHTNNVVVGAGRVYIDPYANGAYEGERYLGDSEGCTLSVQSESLQVFSGDGPVARRLVDVTTQVTYQFATTVRDISLDNLALFASGTLSTVDVSAGEPQGAARESLGPVTQGRWYTLGQSADRPTGVGAVHPATHATPNLQFALYDAAAAGTRFTAGTAYELDAERGRVYIHPRSGAKAAGVIPTGTTVYADFELADEDADRQVVVVSSIRQVRAAFRYLEDPMRGDGRDFYGRLCAWRPNGELALKGRQNEQRIGLLIEVQEPDDAGWPQLAIDGKAA